MTRTEKPALLFVLEQALGHAVHGRNIERVLATEPEIAGEVIRIGAGAGLTSRLPVLGSWSFQASNATRAALRRHLVWKQPDALFIHTQVAALLAGRAMRQIPTIISMDATPVNFDTLAEGYGHARRQGPVEGVKSWVNHRAFDAAKAIVTFSQWAADSVVNDYRIPQEKVNVIRPGVDLRRWRPHGGPREPGPVRILFVGGDMVRKGGYDLLDAVRRLDASVELDMVTSSIPEGPPPPGVTVRFHAGLDHSSPRLHDLYRRADIFALPSRAECYGHVICEAMASGLPVVACGVGAVPELVVDGRTGFLVPPGSPERLAESLGALVQDPALRIRFGEAACRTAQRDHDADRNIHRLFDLMQGLAPGRGRAARREAPERSGAMMLVSADASGRVRADVEAGLRPCPEFLGLEKRFGVRLLDWTALGNNRGRRSGRQSLHHVAAALRGLRQASAVLSDGEHLGIPLALGMRLPGFGRTRHVMIGHHLSGRSRILAFRLLGVRGRLDCVIVHSSNQAELVTGLLHVPKDVVAVVPYAVDTNFWRPEEDLEEDGLVLSVGREHRDFRCLAVACDGFGQVFLTDDSAHSPDAHRTYPDAWPANFTRRSLALLELRAMYARAAVVVVPLLDSPASFGITAVLEAMAMGKAVVVTGTDALRAVVDDRQTGLVVSPGDPVALRDAVRRLLEHPEERRALGQAARAVAEERYGVDLFVARLAQHLRVGDPVAALREEAHER
jgi:glycosyltransferase involved in cell wall biosynthesis